MPPIGLGWVKAVKSLARSAFGGAVNRVLQPVGYRIVRAPGGAIDSALDSDADTWLHDERWELPESATQYLRSDNPRLIELRERYSALDWPVLEHSRWAHDQVGAWLNLKYFRGENIYMWHYRDDLERSRFRYYVYLRYVLDVGGLDLLERLGEDGAFGCWSFEFAGYPTCSRDLLDSVNELLFLDKELGLFSLPDTRMLEIGAGYGRLAHRMVQSQANVAEYCCIDAVPESTFLCEFYTGFREVTPPVTTAQLDQILNLRADHFDLVINVHSFSECTLSAIRWWLDQVNRLGIKRLFLIPNEPEGFLSTEADGSRLDYGTAIRDAGFNIVVEEPVIRDEATRSLLDVQDRFCLFERH